MDKTYSPPKSILSPWKITLPYAVFGILYILFSDKAVSLVFKDMDTILRIQTFKGFGFVIVTAMLLYFLVGKFGSFIVEFYENTIARIYDTERELKLSEERYMALFDENPLPMWIFDPDTLKIGLVNKAACKKYGYTKDEFCQLTISEIRPKEDLELMYKLLNDKKDQKHIIWDTLVRHYTKSGNLLTVKIESVLVMFNNKPSRLVIINDVTEDIKTQKAINDVNLRLKSASEIAGLVYWSKDILNSELYISQELYKLFDVDSSIETLTEDKLFGFVHPNDLELLKQAILSISKNKSVKEVEHRLVLKNGDVKWMLHRIKLVRDSNFRAIRIEGVMMDITERVKHQDMINQSNLKFQSLSNTVFEAIVDWDIAENKVFWGDGFFDLFGYKVNRSDNKLWINGIFEEDKERVINKLKESLEDKDQFNFFEEYRFVKANGDIAFVQHRGVFTRDAKGSATRAIGAIIDITESLNRMAELNKQNEKINKIVWTQSHIVRAPVANIIGLAELLKHRNENRVDSDEIIDLILDSTQKLDKVIHQITKYAN